MNIPIALLNKLIYLDWRGEYRQKPEASSYTPLARSLKPEASSLSGATNDHRYKTVMDSISL